MSWLLHNPVADMPGPQFLAAYGLAALAVVWIVAKKTKRLDPSPGLEPVPLDIKLGPDEIACLSGGSRGLLRVTLFDLWQQGFLNIVEPKSGRRQITLAIDGFSSFPKPSFDQEILDAFMAPRELRGVANDPRLRALAKRRAHELEAALREENLLMPSDARARSRSLTWGALACLLLVAGYKFGLGLVKGYPTVFLILEIVAAAVLVLIVGKLPRITQRGRDYLDRLRLALGGTPVQDPGTTSDTASLNTLLAVAVLGFSALTGTPHAKAWQSINTATGSCGGGCGASAGCGGSGGCGGGGCGGGCGGCGS